MKNVYVVICRDRALILGVYTNEADAAECRANWINQAGNNEEFYARQGNTSISNEPVIGAA